nr:hypothetical protein GCM10020093_033600 [Planobispora longispora]
MIEHDLDVVKSADWVIDLGPDGGDLGGSVVFEGTPERLLRARDSLTAEHLRRDLARRPQGEVPAAGSPRPDDGRAPLSRSTSSRRRAAGPGRSSAPSHG